MCNHYHVVIRIAEARAGKWSDKEVINRWSNVYSVDKRADNNHLVQQWRSRLCSISWFMRCINEPLARLANREDECVGRFWEGRFKSQALLDETAVLKCMTYVDLNPIRAGKAAVPEESDHTSIKARIERTDAHLIPFGDGQEVVASPVNISYRDYLELVDWTGRMLRKDKRGSIPNAVPPIMQRICISGNAWTREIKYYGKWYYRAVGSYNQLELYRKHLGQRWLKGAARAILNRA